MKGYITFVVVASLLGILGVVGAYFLSLKVVEDTVQDDVGDYVSEERFRGNDILLAKGEVLSWDPVRSELVIGSQGGELSLNPRKQKVFEEVGSGVFFVKSDYGVKSGIYLVNYANNPDIIFCVGDYVEVQWPEGTKASDVIDSEGKYIVDRIDPFDDFVFWRPESEQCQYEANIEEEYVSYKYGQFRLGLKFY